MKNGRPLCIVIPCFNEEQRLNIQAFEKYIACHRDAEFCFVDDGSQDGTWGKLESLRSAFPDQVDTLRLEKNSGKAEAVRSGINFMLQSAKSARYIGFWDADLATPLDEIDSFYRTLQESDSYVAASGSRIKRMGASIERNFGRDVESRIFSVLSSMVLGLAFRETQCGAKLFERSVAERIFESPFISPWVFDIEIFARIRELYGKEKAKKIICEVPLKSWREMPGSKMRFTGKLKSLVDLLSIFRHYRLPWSEPAESKAIKNAAMKSCR